jgi:hypothetical protein
MTITKHFCDYCGREMLGPIGIGKSIIHFCLEAKIHAMHHASGDKEYKGDFCSVECAGRFILNDGPSEKMKAVNVWVTP